MTKRAPEPVVTEHAMLRFLQRSGRVDLSALASEILSPEVLAAMRAGATSIKVGDLTFILRGHSVISVLPRNGKATRVVR